MDCVALWFSDDDDDERAHRKIIRDHTDIMSLNNLRFVKNFPLNKNAFTYVLESIKDELTIPARSTAVRPDMKLAATLKFLAQGGYQHQIGQDRFLGLAQQTVSSCVSEVCTAIEKILCPRHINFVMTDVEKQSAKKYFYTKSGIPGVIGVVDGTHIQMVRPSKNEHLYFNRKLKHSINAMVICDHKMSIRYVNARYGGAAHDSHVWNLSQARESLKQNFESGDKSTWILGDSGYPLEPWILTPYRNAGEQTGELRFNQKFSNIRSIIERVFGVLKGRFRCLLSARELYYAPEKTSQILNVCCALHNICLSYNVEQPKEIECNEYDTTNVYNNSTSESYNYLSIARALREQTKNNMSS